MRGRSKFKPGSEGWLRQRIRDPLMQAGANLTALTETIISPFIDIEQTKTGTSIESKFNAGTMTWEKRSAVELWLVNTGMLCPPFYDGQDATPLGKAAHSCITRRTNRVPSQEWENDRKKLKRLAELEVCVVASTLGASEESLIGQILPHVLRLEGRRGR